MDELRARALDAELDWLRWQVELALARHRAVGLCPAPEAPTAGRAVTPPEVESTIAQLRGELGAPCSDLIEAMAQAAQAAGAVREGLRAEAAVAGVPLPLDLVAEAFGLTGAERLLLLLSLAADLDGRFGRLFAYLQNHFDRPHATLDLLQRLGAGALSLGESANLLSPGGTLRFHGLVRLEERAGLPLVVQPVLVDGRIRRFVTGETALDPELAGYATLHVGPPGPGPLRLSPDENATFRRFAALVSSRRGQPALVLLQGPQGAGRARWVRELAHENSRPCLVLDLPGLARQAGGLAEALRRAVREARLHGALLVVRGWESLGVSGAASEESQRADQEAASLLLLRALRGHREPVFLALEEDSAAPVLALEVGRFRVGLPDEPSAAALWRDALPEAQRAPGLQPETLGFAVGLSPGRIESACRDARREVGARDGEAACVDRDALARALKAGTRHSLGNSAVLVESPHDWEDLIVLDDVRAQLLEMRSRYRNRQKVMDGWGLRRRFRSAVGLSALFDGPPGTGKTMAAGIIARDLGLDLYQIDLSRVVDRYVGETEKKLARIFDEAERAQVMLLFDEADSLFSSRTKVQSANDRYANLEVNYLLQRLDQFRGVAVLTTNFAESIDHAFVRRLTLRVTFPRPEAGERARLWASMLAQPGLPQVPIDFAELAEAFELSGGQIRNAVLRAAYTAAAVGRPVDPDLLALAARVELKQGGMLVAGNPYADLMQHVGS